jgi:hypothetical protein
MEEEGMRTKTLQNTKDQPRPGNLYILKAIFLWL